MKRRERNRRSAQKCRERKVQRTHELQAQVECLQMEANRLTQELESWRNQARHCVALLQLHCPGVSIPYISCLNEPIERPPECITDACEELLQLDEHNTTVGEAVSTYRGTKSARKQQQHQTHSISNMTNTTANRSEEMQVVNGTPQASFGTLPTMVSLHSQQTSPGRSKSLFTFPPTISSDNDSPGGASKVSRLHSPLTSSLGPPVGGMSRSNHHAGRPESVGAAQRCQTSSSTSSVAMSVRESASASSSSSCSTYELPLVSCFDQPQQPQPPTPMHTVTSFGRTCGGDSSSHSNTNNNESRDDCTTTRVNVSTAVTSHVLNGASVEHISVVDLQPPHNKYDTVTMEEWNAAYLNSEAMNLGESGSISSISSSPRLNLLGTPSDVPDSNVGSSDLLN